MDFNKKINILLIQPGQKHEWLKLLFRILTTSGIMDSLRRTRRRRRRCRRTSTRSSSRRSWGWLRSGWQALEDSSWQLMHSHGRTYTSYRYIIHFLQVYSYYTLTTGIFILCTYYRYILINTSYRYIMHCLQVYSYFTLPIYIRIFHIYHFIWVYGY